MGGAFIGGLTGLAGAGVGSLVAGGSFFGGSVATTIGFGSGFTSGAAGGFVGGAGNAWLNGANFGDGLMAGLQGGVIGGVAGGLINGISSGIRAIKHGGDFLSGRGVVFETTAIGANKTSIEDGLEYSNEYAKDFSDNYFGEVKDLNSLNANGSVPRKGGYYSRDGMIFNSENKLVNGVTQYIKKGESDVFLSKSAFGSKEILFHAMRHEYIHVTHGLMHSRGLLNLNSSYQGMLRTEISAYNWGANLSFKNGYHSWNNRLGLFSWKIDNWFNWLPSSMPKF